MCIIIDISKIPISVYIFLSLIYILLESDINWLLARIQTGWDHTAPCRAAPHPWPRPAPPSSSSSSSSWQSSAGSWTWPGWRRRAWVAGRGPACSPPGGRRCLTSPPPESGQSAAAPGLKWELVEITIVRRLM